MEPTSPDAATRGTLERQIEAWRAHLRKGRAVTTPDLEELEDHLREQIAGLVDDGLSEDEALLVAVKRMGAVDALTREFAREHEGRLWKQLVLAGDGTASVGGGGARTLRVALALAVMAVVASQVPTLLGAAVTAGGAFYPLNLAFFVLPFVAAYFAWERPLPRGDRIGVAAVFLLAAGVVNVFPFPSFPGAHTALLAALHLPIALWLVVGSAYVGGRWWESGRRMDFVRFTGELFVYCVLIALGGGVLIALTVGLFGAIGIDVESHLERWIVPGGVAGTAVIATWLVEAKQSIVENIAPVLARVFAPLFALVLLAFATTMAWTGRGFSVDREILIAFDLLLAVVFGLLLYSVSARDPLAPPDLLDRIQLALVGTALVLDVLALLAIGARISDFGLTPNRAAALGLNAVLLGNLAGSALLYAGFLANRAPFSRLLEWQTSYLYVFAAWAAIVAFLFPPLFGFT